MKSGEECLHGNGWTADHFNDVFCAVMGLLRTTLRPAPRDLGDIMHNQTIGLFMGHLPECSIIIGVIMILREKTIIPNFAANLKPFRETLSSGVEASPSMAYCLVDPPLHPRYHPRSANSAQRVRPSPAVSYFSSRVPREKLLS